MKTFLMFVLLLGITVTFAPLEAEAVSLGDRVQVTMRDGNVFQGILSGEASEYVLVRVGDNNLKLYRNTIEEMRLIFEDSLAAPKIEPLRAMWSSLIIPGFGQFLNGDIAKGFLHLGPAIGLFINMAYTYMSCTDRSTSGTFCDDLDTLIPAIVPYMAWSFYSAADAYTGSERNLMTQ
jgi:hypothetical protein